MLLYTYFCLKLLIDRISTSDRGDKGPGRPNRIKKQIGQERIRLINKTQIKMLHQIKKGKGKQRKDIGMRILMGRMIQAKTLGELILKPKKIQKQIILKNALKNLNKMDQTKMNL